MFKTGHSKILWNVLQLDNILSASFYCVKNVFCNGILNFLAIYFQAAKKFVSGKKSMASGGNLIKTPFVDEI